MQETILITGGTGLVGSHLTKLLLNKGYEVRHLSRSRSNDEFLQSFKWSVEKNTWDAKAIENVNYIVHLAGANVADGRWTSRRKQQILESRISGSKLILEMVEASNGKVKGVISASAVGYYGTNNIDKLAVETDNSGDDFLANVCLRWEKEIQSCNTKVAVLRTGVVLSKEGGAVPKMLAPIKLGLGAPLGSGIQPMPWIHIDDLCNMYLFAIKNKLEGTYNAVAPETVNNKEFTHQLAKKIKRRIFLPNVPSFIMKLILGEMSTMLLTGVNVSAKKILKAGFDFEHPTLSKAVSQF